MRLRSVLAMVAGSVLVHAAVSCTSAAIHDADRDAGRVDAIAETIADAVQEVLGGDDAKQAEAAPPGPAFTVDEVPCTTEKPWGSGKLTYAEKAYPGRTKDDLARVSVLICGEPNNAEGYACHSTFVFVRDGSIAAQCAAPAVARFVVPTL